MIIFDLLLQTLYMAIVVYAPALALSQCKYLLNYQKRRKLKFFFQNFLIFLVTGFDVDAACAVIFAVCIFYTTIVRKYMYFLT